MGIFSTAGTDPNSQVGLGAGLTALFAIELVAAHPVLWHQVAPGKVVFAEGV
jgi:hypothetical protein